MLSSRVRVWTSRGSWGAARRGKEDLLVVSYFFFPNFLLFEVRELREQHRLRGRTDVSSLAAWLLRASAAKELGSPLSPAFP